MQPLSINDVWFVLPSPKKPKLIEYDEFEFVELELTIENELYIDESMHDIKKL